MKRYYSSFKLWVNWSPFSFFKAIFKSFSKVIHVYCLGKKKRWSWNLKRSLLFALYLLSSLTNPSPKGGNHSLVYILLDIVYAYTNISCFYTSLISTLYFTHTKNVYEPLSSTSLLYSVLDVFSFQCASICIITFFFKHCIIFHIVGISWFIYSFIDRHLDCFQFGAIISSI